MHRAVIFESCRLHSPLHKRHVLSHMTWASSALAVGDTARIAIAAKTRKTMLSTLKAVSEWKENHSPFETHIFVQHSGPSINYCMGGGEG